MTTNARPTADIEELRELVASVLELPATEITDDAHFVDEFNIDSLLELEIAARLEKTYRIEVPDLDIKSLTSLEKVRDYVDRKLDEKSADEVPNIRAWGNK